MEIIKILGIAFVTALAAIVLKGSKPELAFAVTVAGVVLVLISAFDVLKDTLSVFVRLQELSGISNVLIRQLLKMIGIGYLTQFGAGLVEDFGSVSLADKVVFAGKIVIFALAVPIIENLLQLIVDFLELV